MNFCVNIIVNALSFLKDWDRDLWLSYRLNAFFVKIANWTRCAHACILTMFKRPFRNLHLSVFDFLGSGVPLSTSLKISHTHRIWVCAESELWLRLRGLRVVLIVLYSQPLAAVILLFDTWEVVVLRWANGAVMRPALLVCSTTDLLILYWNVLWLWIRLYLTFP